MCLYIRAEGKDIHCLSPVTVDGRAGLEEGLGNIHSSYSQCCPSGIPTHYHEAPKGTSLSSPASFRAEPRLEVHTSSLCWISAPQGAALCLTAELARGVRVAPGEESPSQWGHAEVTSCEHWGTPRCCRSSLHTLSPQMQLPSLCQRVTPSQLNCSPTQGCKG